MSGATDNALGLYVSIPFCRSKCTYCNFASGVYPASDHARYVERLIEDLGSARKWTEGVGAELPCRVDTVYLGGGTPTVLSAELLARLFAAMRAEFDFDADAEITVECAPLGQMDDTTLEAMAAAGVNRVSLGVQSVCGFWRRMPAWAAAQPDDRCQAGPAAWLRGAGITNLNVDLIAGLAGQTAASWDESLDVLIGSGVTHASIYMLEVDEDSRLGREMLAGGSRYRAGLVPNDDAIARMYEKAIERLRASGLQQYEISNFSRDGFQSRHNLRYWERRPYLGVGLDASSALALHAAASRTRDVLRAKTTDDLKEFLTGSRIVEMARLSPAQQHEEAWFLGLRLNAGVDVAALEDEFGPEMAEPAMEIVERLVGDGLLTFDRERVRLTARGRLISNDVFQEFLGMEIRAVEAKAST